VISLFAGYISAAHMQILEYPFVWEWCREHETLDEDAEGSEPPRLSEDRRLVHRSRTVFAPRGPVGYEPAVADAILSVLGTWDECLLWVTGWGVWPSSEDWPRYYAWRSRHGSRLALENAPGHLAAAGEDVEFRELLLQVLNNGWDAIVLSARAGHLSPRRVRISHDGWAEVHACEAIALHVAGVAGEPIAAADAPRG
jgi:hypothetical protein